MKRRSRFTGAEGALPIAEKPLQVIQEDGDGGKVVYCRKKDDEALEGLLYVT